MPFEVAQLKQSGFIILLRLAVNERQGDSTRREKYLDQ